MNKPAWAKDRSGYGGPIEVKKFEFGGGQRWPESEVADRSWPEGGRGWLDGSGHENRNRRIGSEK